MGADYTTTNNKIIKMGDVLQSIQNDIQYGNRLLVAPFAQDLQNGYTLSVDAVIGEYELTLTSVTGFATNSLIKVEEELNGEPTTFFAHVLSIATNTLTLDRPIDRTFTTASLINRENHLLNVNGSGTPIEFVYKNSFGKTVNVARMLFNMVTDNNTPFNGFGDIAAPGITNGIELRKKNTDGTYTNFFNAKTNNRLQLLMFDIDFFNSTHPQAVNGLSGRLTFEKFGSPVVLEEGEELQILVQDNLLTLLSFEAVVEGNREV